MDDGKEGVPCMIARCKCGCGGIVLAIAGDISVMDKRRLGEAAVDGYPVEKITVGEARTSKWGCRSSRKEAS